MSFRANDLKTKKEKYAQTVSFRYTPRHIYSSQYDQQRLPRSLAPGSRLSRGPQTTLSEGPSPLMTEFADQEISHLSSS